MSRLGSEFFTDREISALHRENVGKPYERMAVIKDRVIEAQIEAALRPTKTCAFHNKYGWCKLDEFHDGQHTVIFLGDDD